MNPVEHELLTLAQVDVQHQQHLRWDDLRRAVVLHLDELPHEPLRIEQRVYKNEICPDLLENKPCTQWTTGTPCHAKWHPEFLQVLTDDVSQWIWLPRRFICRTHQRALGTRPNRYTCTDPNCPRTHANSWLFAELFGFRWYVQHAYATGLCLGYTLDGDLIAVSSNMAYLTLATMPYMDQEFYQQFKWYSPIPQPEAYGQMMVTAQSFRPNLNPQPGRRDVTPRRHTSPRRARTPNRRASPARQRSPTRPAPTPKPRAPTPPRTTAWPEPEPHGQGDDPWNQHLRDELHNASPPTSTPTSATPLASPWDQPATPWDPQPTTQPVAPEPPAPCPCALPVTPAIISPRRKTTPEGPMQMAINTLRQTAGNMVHSIPANMPNPAQVHPQVEIIETVMPQEINPMAQSWNYISGFPVTQSPPRIPDTILGAWFQRPPSQFTRQMPPTHSAGLPALLREDSAFHINSQLLNEFTDRLRGFHHVGMGTWGTIIEGPMAPCPGGGQYFDRLQLIPMATETDTADASLLKFWWHQHLLQARDEAQEQFSTGRAGPEIISEHVQAFFAHSH